MEKCKILSETGTMKNKLGLRIGNRKIWSRSSGGISRFRGLGHDPNKPQKGVDDNRRTACQFVKDSSYKERGEEEW